jgi:hypothetical protein
MLAALSVLLSASFRHRPPPPAAPPPVYPLSPDPAAAAALAQARGAIDPERTGWMQTAIRQKFNTPPLAVDVEGTYLAGPGNRFRLDLQTRAGNTRRTIHMFCDGKTLWEIEEGPDTGIMPARNPAPGNETTWINKVDLEQVGRLLNRPDGGILFREACRQHGLAGPQMLLEELARQITFTRTDRMQWQKRDAIVLTGARPPSAKPWPDFLPRQCRLILDARTYWPWRVEWWGPVPQRTGDVLLVHVEFGALSSQPRTDDLFTFSPGPFPVRDHTPIWTERLKVLAGN